MQDEVRKSGDPIRSDEEVELTRQWVRQWEARGAFLERVKRKELREMDNQREIELLLGDYDYTVPPRAPLPTSGLIEMQRYFIRWHEREQGPRSGD